MLNGFEWDTANVSHIQRHGVTPFEVEEIATGRHVRFPAVTKRAGNYSEKRHPTATSSWCSPYAVSFFAP